VVLFSVPGAFTPTCDAKHLPGFVELADKIKAKGVDTIACTAVNDVFVMNAWVSPATSARRSSCWPTATGIRQGARTRIERHRYGMGMRGQRFAIIAKNGVATHVNIEAPGEFKVSAADFVLTQL